VLREGDEVRLVSPAGPLRAQRLEAGLELLSSWGLTVTLGAHVYDRAGYLAGADADRAADLNDALTDPAVRAVICTRGGYGTQRILAQLSYDAVLDDPKLVVGFSDITALQLALWRYGRLPGVHGPGAAWDTTRTGAASAESLRRALFTDEPAVIAPRATEETAPVRTAGMARGTLLGGNLCLLTSTVGTADAPDLRGAILLLEEVEEPPYKVDRMLLHLRRSGALDGIAGVAVGQFTRCQDGWPVTVAEVLQDHLGGLGVPVLGGLPLGHGEDQLTVAVGVEAQLDADAGTLTVESAGRRRSPE
jgi:muramoyltetrapeptide carboxypeptidase